MTPPPPPPLLELEDISRRFGGLLALNRVSVRVEEGEILGLIGPNGAGKTTLFNLISGVTPPSAGRILWRGEPIRGLSEDRVNRLGIARTFQNLRLFGPLSCLENVLVGLHHRGRSSLVGALLARPGFRLQQAKLRLQALELLELLDLAEQSDQPAASLPYGLQRRLEIARALATAPRLLLLDEPAAGMNPGEKEELSGLIQRLRQQFALTLLVIEHHVPLMMRLCDRIAVLNFGERIAEGPPEAVRRDPAVIAAYLGVDG